MAVVAHLLNQFSPRCVDTFVSLLWIEDPRLALACLAEEAGAARLPSSPYYEAHSYQCGTEDWEHYSPGSPD